MSNFRRTEKYIKAMILSGPVDEMTDENNKTSVAYCNDDLAQSGTGNYVVQSLTINEKQKKAFDSTNTQ